jgi:chromatin remodeling complex protein RSC6
MVRKSAPPAATAATATATIPTEVVVKKTTSKKAAAAPVAVAPVETIQAPVAVAPVDEAAIAAPVDATNDSLLKFVEFSAKLQNLSTLLSAARIEFKQLEKQVSKELKKKARGGKKKLSGNRSPSGFIKPAKISEDLANFLGKPVGIEMARTEVSKEINQYIRQNNLKDPANGRNINPDAKLTTLLKLEKDDKLTYFNLQKFMKHHFIKEVAAPVSTA